ncbi:MAG: GIY-YIG nuclease family protein [Saprospiraceae bacterium]|nr:GIY-YIG nuclease family protein [Saprospiraceae bacterium]
MWTVYAIKSLYRNYIYVGLTNNLERRVSEHNKGYNKKTKPYLPFTLLHSEVFPSREEARKREKQLKSGSGKEFLKRSLDK